MKAQPTVILKAKYADSSYFETDMFGERGILRIDFGDAYAYIKEFTNSKLTEWEKANTKSPATSYTVYISITAEYEDGRKAERRVNDSGFKSVEDTMKYIDEKTMEMLRVLKEIGSDDV